MKRIIVQLSEEDFDYMCKVFCDGQTKTPHAKKGRENDADTIRKIINEHGETITKRDIIRKTQWMEKVERSRLINEMISHGEILLEKKRPATYRKSNENESDRASGTSRAL